MTRSPRPRKPSALSRSTRQQLNSYALAASAAGVSVLALARASEAKVIYTETHQVTRARVPLYIDLNHDGVKDFVLRTMYYRGSYSEVGLDASGYCNVNNAVAGKRFSRSSYFFSAASALPAGARIGPKTQIPRSTSIYGGGAFQSSPHQPAFRRRPVGRQRSGCQKSIPGTKVRHSRQNSLRLGQSQRHPWALAAIQRCEWHPDRLRL